MDEDKELVVGVDAPEPDFDDEDVAEGDDKADEVAEVADTAPEAPVELGREATNPEIV